MIDFRYHIVSIVAVFLALGLGVVAGTTVLDRVVVDRLDGNLSRLRVALDEHRKDIAELEADKARSSDLIQALAPRVTEGVLVGMRVLFVTGESEAGWHGRVRELITDAGAEDVGSIELTMKWALEERTDRDELIRAFGTRTLAERDPASDAARQLGEAIAGDPEDLVPGLSDAGFLRAAPVDPSGAFPPATAQVVVLASPDDVPLASLALGASQVTSTLVVAGDMEHLGPLEVLRRGEEATGRLATFDSASSDPGGVGIVLALRAAADNAGGHFGLGPDVRYLPAPP